MSEIINEGSLHIIIDTGGVCMILCTSIHFAIILGRHGNRPYHCIISSPRPVHVYGHVPSHTRSERDGSRNGAAVHNSSRICVNVSV